MFQRLTRRRERITMEVEPPNWDYLQAIRFCTWRDCVTCFSSSIRRHLSANKYLMIDYATLRPWTPKQFGVLHQPGFNDRTHPSNFVGRMLAGYIKIRSVQLGRLLAPYRDPAFETFWQNYSKNILELVEMIRFFMRGGMMRGISYIYSCFYTLWRLSLSLHWSLWQSHIRGAVAYIDSIGGPMAMIEAGRHGPPLAFTRLLSCVFASCANLSLYKDANLHA